MVWTRWTLHDFLGPSLPCVFHPFFNHLFVCAPKHFWGCDPNSGIPSVVLWRACLLSQPGLLAAFLKTIIVSGLWVSRFLWKFMPLNIWLESSSDLGAFRSSSQLQSIFIYINPWKFWETLIRFIYNLGALSSSLFISVQQKMGRCNQGYQRWRSGLNLGVMVAQIVPSPWIVLSLPLFLISMPGVFIVPRKLEIDSELEYSRRNSLKQRGTVCGAVRFSFLRTLGVLSYIFFHPLMS